MKPKLYTIIVTYNGYQWIEKCLNSLVQSSLQTQIILVDNNSSDETLNLVEHTGYDVTVLKQKKNLGFGKANNIGISYALKQGAEYVFLLNQDAYVEKDCLRNLLKTSKTYPNFGILSPIHLTWDGNQLEHYFARFVQSNPDFYSDFVLKRSSNAVYKVPFIQAAAWFIPRKVFLDVGGFDPIFHHYGEDNNYCQRVLFHGFKIGVVSDTFICHDSNIRTEPNDYLFSEAYYLNEVKQLQITYANINRPFSIKDIQKEKKHLNALILINLLKFKIKAIQGYIKKYRIFLSTFKKIQTSREQTLKKHPHYLDI